MRPRSAAGTIDLPKYVRARGKPSGRVYYYYERYRQTERAWPPLALPRDPSDPEFWRRCQQCTDLDAVREREEWNWFIVGKTGHRHALPCPSTGGMDAFWEAIDKSQELDKAAEGQAGKTFSALISTYKAHTKFTKLADGTQEDYARFMDEIERIWGDDPVVALTTTDAQRAVDSLQDKPAKSRYFRAVLSRLIAFGIPRGFSTINVVSATEKVAYDSEPHVPWPDWAFEVFFEHARIGLHLPVYSALYTGQRSSDVIPMLRPQIGANAIELRTQKTKANTFIPIHSEFRLVLTAAHAEHPQLHLREDGAPWTVEGYRTAWQREFTSVNAKGKPTLATPAKKAAMERLRNAGLVFHGLRKNAVNMLLEAGCTEAEVSAIVEMSEQMVRHYSRDVNKRRLARAAMRKLETGWDETRRNLLGNTPQVQQ